jgi:hypothetical protein
VPRCHRVPRRARPCGATVHDRADAARHPRCPANPRRPRCEAARAACCIIPPDQVHGSCRPPRSPDHSAVRTADQPSPLGTAPARDLPNRPAVPIIHRRQLTIPIAAAPRGSVQSGFNEVAPNARRAMTLVPRPHRSLQILSRELAGSGRITQAKPSCDRIRCTCVPHGLRRCAARLLLLVGFVARALLAFAALAVWQDYMAERAR